MANIDVSVPFPGPVYTLFQFVWTLRFCSSLPCVHYSLLAPDSVTVTPAEINLLSERYKIIQFEMYKVPLNEEEKYKFSEFCVALPYPHSHPHPQSFLF